MIPRKNGCSSIAQRVKQSDNVSLAGLRARIRIRSGQVRVRDVELLIFEARKLKLYPFYSFSTYMYFPASAQAVVTGVVPSTPAVLASFNSYRP